MMQKGRLFPHSWAQTLAATGVELAAQREGRVCWRRVPPFFTTGLHSQGSVYALLLAGCMQSLVPWHMASAQLTHLACDLRPPFPCE